MITLDVKKRSFKVVNRMKFKSSFLLLPAEYSRAFPEHIYNPITPMGFSTMFTFQLDNNCRHPIAIMGQFGFCHVRANISKSNVHHYLKLATKRICFQQYEYLCEFLIFHLKSWLIY